MLIFCAKHQPPHLTVGMCPFCVIASLHTEVERLNRELESVKDALDEKNRAYHYLASEMVYRGNSVQHWAKRADARGEAIDKVFKAFGGANGRESVYDMAGRIVAERDAALAEVERLKGEAK